MVTDSKAIVGSQKCEASGCNTVIPSERVVIISQYRRTGRRSTDGEVAIVGGLCGLLKPFLCIPCQQKADRLDYPVATSNRRNNDDSWFSSQHALAGAGVCHSLTPSV